MGTSSEAQCASKSASPENVESENSAQAAAESAAPRLDVEPLTPVETCSATEAALAMERLKLAMENLRIAEAATAGSEIHEPRGEYYLNQIVSATGDDLGASDLSSVSAASFDRIEAFLRALQTGLSRIESKLANLAR